MLVLLNRCVAALAFVAALIPTPAAAGRITDLELLLVGEGFILRGGYQFTMEDLAALADRSDNGWHLGWFKNNPHGGGSNFGGGPFGSNGNGPFFIPGVSSGGGVIPTPGGLPPSLFIPHASTPPGATGAGAFSPPGGTGAVEPLVVPEPQSLLLLGVGLLLVARRLRHRPSDRRSPQN